MKKSCLFLSLFFVLFSFSGCIKSNVKDEYLKQSENQSSFSSSYSQSSSDENVNSKSNLNNNSNNTKSILFGTTFSLYSGFDKDGNKLSLEQIKHFTKDITIKFTDNSNCEISALDTSTCATYTLNGNNLLINDGEFSGVLNKNTITIEYQSMKIVLKKVWL